MITRTLAALVRTLAVLACLTSVASAEPPSLQVDIAPSSVGAHVAVVLTNVGKGSLRVFREWCSWGYYGVSFEVTTPDGKTVTLRKRERVWTKNAPANDELAPTKSIELRETLSTDEWVLPKVSGKVTLRAIYRIDPTAESKQLGVWTGDIRSPPVPYKLP